MTRFRVCFSSRKSNRHDPLLFAGLAAAVLSGACSTKVASQSKSSAEPLGYPRGPWWRGDANQTLLGASHILISYKGTVRKEQLFAVPGAPSGRSRGDALAIALRLRSELAEHPEHFEALAEKYSDDPMTALLHGMIGESFATHLPDAMIDALGNLRAGEVSRVVESRLGFHIVRRNAVRPEVKMDASQIVVGYADSDTSVRVGRKTTRTREEARALAEQIRARAVQNPSTFADLAKAESDSFEGEFGGDIGQWSSQARNGEPTTLAVLRDLAIGQVSAVLDTPQGFRILKRDADKEREGFAVAALVIAYSNPLLTDAPPREAALAAAQEVLAAARQHPEQFNSLREQHCDYNYCEAPALPFKDGNVMFGGVVGPLRKVPVGTLVDQVIDTPRGFALVRREDSAKYPFPAPRAVNYELPRPAMPNIETATTAELTWYLGRLRGVVRDEMRLDAKQTEGVNAVFERLETAYDSAPANERAQFELDANREFAQVLGPEKSAELDRINANLLRSIQGDTVAGSL